MGAKLRARREAEGLTLEDLAGTTRVRRVYLEAIEEERWNQLPAGPFAVGYVRAYAQALGMSGDEAVAAMRAEAPAVARPQAAPGGIARQESRSFAVPIYTGLGLVLTAVIVWNVVQRATAPEVETPVVVVDDPAQWAAAAAAQSTSAPSAIGAPLPPPADQTVPAPYETPGLLAAMSESVGPASAATPPRPAAPQTPVRAAFNPRGTVHGAEPQASRVTIQARRATSVVVRRPDGAVLFARHLAPGEAYRAPNERGLTVDISEAGVADVYVDGEFRAQLQAQQNRLDAISG